ncbi:hypothetical protein GCM10011610_68390 [Nocardia rhizosphaerihabitans]|uniref:Uncharacterized protein n=1 Tax=Nocardia rhizosphaerihabitans TaxID=1691570 RepID=A0ABQ2L1Z7_9NOCA|nr:hypothetical protein GCM10011610_68390 [Nocardia rhizosphaerihabitans]
MCLSQLGYGLCPWPVERLGDVGQADAEMRHGGLGKDDHLCTGFGGVSHPVPQERKVVCRISGGRDLTQGDSDSGRAHGRPSCPARGIQPGLLSR